MKLNPCRRAVVISLLVLLSVLSLAGCQFWDSAAVPTSTPARLAVVESDSDDVQVDQAVATTTAVLVSQPSAVTADFSSAIRQVAQKAKPGVVQITNQQTQVDQFNQPFTVPSGVGSGVIYDRRGYILTNNHVVEGAEQLLVSLPDGRLYQGQLLGADSKTDLAVVKIEGDNLPTVPLGDSSQLQVGDWVVAIGNALALPGGPTVTAGVISSLGRTVQEPGSAYGSQGPYLYDVIQTDAPINQGNSGGPLLNLAGEVIGINTMIAGQAESGVPAQGIGFAIAITTAKPIADQLVTTGRAIHPYLGIYYLPLNSAIAAQLDIQQQNGLVIRSVVRNSPAAGAGLRVGDIVTAVDGQELAEDSALDKVINSHKVGDVITLTVIRSNSSLSVPVKLGETPTP